MLSRLTSQIKTRLVIGAVRTMATKKVVPNLSKVPLSLPAKQCGDWLPESQDAESSKTATPAGKNKVTLDSDPITLKYNSRTPLPILTPPKPKLQITFTCTAPVEEGWKPPHGEGNQSNLGKNSQANGGHVIAKRVEGYNAAGLTCGHRSTHQFSKLSYEKGVVLITCPTCSNRHLIADNLGWFANSPASPRNIEQMLLTRGEIVKRGKMVVTPEQDVSFEPPEGYGAQEAIWQVQNFRREMAKRRRERHRKAGKTITPLRWARRISQQPTEAQHRLKR